MVYLSVLIPAYNEESRIGPTLARTHDYLSAKGYDYEVVLVDDGSVDGTVEVSMKSRLYRENKLSIVRNGRNRGKGFSFKNGVSRCKGEYVLLCDADMSTDISEVEKLLNRVESGYDIAVGSRIIEGSRVDVRQSWLRRKGSAAFNFLVNLILVKGISDTECGFKLFKRSVASGLAEGMKIFGFTFDVEVLYMAQRDNYRIAEVGITWNNSPKSKVRLYRDIPAAFIDIFRIMAAHRGRNSQGMPR